MPEAAANPVKNEAARTRNIVLASSPVMMLRTLLLVLFFVFRLSSCDCPSAPRVIHPCGDVPSSSSSVYHPVVWMDDSSRMVTDHHAVSFHGSAFVASNLGDLIPSWMKGLCVLCKFAVKEGLGLEFMPNCVGPVLSSHDPIIYS